MIVADSNIVKPAQPAWVLNLSAHPEAEVQLGRERYQAWAAFLEGEDRTGQWDRLGAGDPGYDWVAATRRQRARCHPVTQVLGVVRVAIPEPRKRRHGSASAPCVVEVKWWPS